MKVAVFGATGKTGKEIVGQALAKGHEVTAFVRETSRLTLENEYISVEDRLRFVSGDVFDFSAVKQAIQGQEAVICSLGSTSLTEDPPKQWTQRRDKLSTLVLEERNEQKESTVSRRIQGASHQLTAEQWPLSGGR